MSRSNSIEIRAEGVIVNPRGYKEVDVELEGVDVAVLLEHVTAEQAIDYFGKHEILNLFSVQEVIDHFGEGAVFEALDVDPGFEKLR